MEIIELTEDNVEEYSEYLGPDKAENIGREYYRGIVVINEKKVPESAAIWELLHLEDEKRDTEARVAYAGIRRRCRTVRAVFRRSAVR